jgi:hypothetical protein
MLNKKRKTIQKPLKVECFYAPLLGNKCGTIFEVKYNRSRGEYTQRNNWGYWTEKEEDKGKYICNNCLISFYRNDKYNFWEKITSEKKRNILRTYVNSNSLKHKRKIMECDDKGCKTTCCYGCRCCEEKTKIINDLTKRPKELRKS